MSVEPESFALKEASVVAVGESQVKAVKNAIEMVRFRPVQCSEWCEWSGDPPLLSSPLFFCPSSHDPASNR
jgi:hypothetical protein